MLRQRSEGGVVNGQEFRSGKKSVNLELDTRHIVSSKIVFRQSGVVCYWIRGFRMYSVIDQIRVKKFK